MGRKKLTENTSWDDGYGIVAYTADALMLTSEDGDAAISALAIQVEEVLSQWELLDAERRAKRRAMGRSNALERRRDVQADAAATDLHNDVLAQVKQNRKAPLFVRIFVHTLSTIIRMALESELPVLRTMALKLAEPETPEAIRSAHQAAMTHVIERGEASLRGREAAVAAAGLTSARVTAWREESNTVLLGVEGALKQIASQRKMENSTKWVDSFFPAADRGKKKTAVAASKAKSA